MFDAKSLLDQFLGGQQGNNRQGQDVAPRQGGFDMSRIKDQLGGLGQQFGGGGGGLGSGLGGLGGIAGGTLAGGLAGLLLGSKKGRKMAGSFAGSALKIGGVAVVGALAYTAYRNWQAGRAPAASSGAATPSEVPMLPPPSGTPFNPSNESDQQFLGLTLLRAMIAAAKADGHVDAKEQANIFAEMDKLALDNEAKAFVIDELRAPLDIDAVARAARTQEEAVEIYAASLLVIDVDHAAERAYLAMLAARLNLDDKLVEHLHATINAAVGKAAAETAPAQTSAAASVPSVARTS